MLHKTDACGLKKDRGRRYAALRSLRTTCKHLGDENEALHALKKNSMKPLMTANKDIPLPQFRRHSDHLSTGMLPNQATA